MMTTQITSPRSIGRGDQAPPYLKIPKTVSECCTVHTNAIATHYQLGACFFNNFSYFLGEVVGARNFEVKKTPIVPDPAANVAGRRAGQVGSGAITQFWSPRNSSRQFRRRRRSPLASIRAWPGVRMDALANFPVDPADAELLRWIPVRLATVKSAATHETD